MDGPPLHVAAQSNDNPDIIKALIAAGADPMAQTEDGWTPLHVAAQCSEKPVVIETLLEAGADPVARDKNDVTPWDLAERHNRTRGFGAYQRLKGAQF